MNNVRYGLFILIISVLFSIVFVKAFRVSVIHHKEYLDKYINHITRIVYKKGKRGDIFDNKNRILAIDYPSYDLFVDPKYYYQNISYYKQKGDGYKYVNKINRFIDRLSVVTNQSSNNILSIIEKNKNKRFVVLKKDIKHKQYEQLIEDFMPKSFGFIKQYRRYYPDGKLSAHNIGFCYSNGLGAEALEKYYDTYLKPEIKKDRVVLDQYKYVFLNAPKNGYTLHTTIDRSIQDYVHIELEKTIKQYNADSGMIVVMNPFNGAILAMDSYPFYDNNNYKQYTYNYIRNRSVADVFEPGSVFKLIVLSAALDSGLLKGNEIVYCENGSWKLNNKIIHDDHKFKWLSFDNVFIHSSNIGSAKIAILIGKKVFYKYLSKFSFGQRTGIDTISESKGIVKDIFSIGDFDLANMAFGQGIGVTEIQLARAFSVVANGGYLVKPHFLTFIEDDKGDKILKFNSVKKRILRNTTVQKIKSILQKVTEQGTGIKAQTKHYTTAGKTGTAQIPKKGSYDTNEYIASFAGFAPVKTPKIVVAISIVNPKNGQFYGGDVAAPLFARIVNFVLHYYAVRQDK